MKKTKTEIFALVVLGLFTIAMIAGVLTMFSGCGSPTIDVWADRGQQGIGYTKENITEFADTIRKTLTAREASELDAVFQDIKDAAVAKKLNDQWLNDHKAGLKLILATWQKDRDAVDAAVAKAMDNLDQISECFDQIVRLRKSFSLTPELQAQVERLTIIVSQLVQETRNGER